MDVNPKALSRTYHNKRVGYTGYYVELRLENERKVTKDSTKEIYSHKWDRDTLDLSILVYLVVLRTVWSYSRHVWYYVIYDTRLTTERMREGWSS